MSAGFWWAIGLLTAAASMFAYQHRALTRHTHDGPYVIQCGNCWETYTCTEYSGIRAAMMLHTDYHCTLSGYDQWRNVG